MASYKWGNSFSICRLQIDFKSHVKFSSLMGTCYGIAAIPILLLFNINTFFINTNIIFIFLLIIFSPISGFISGFIMGIIGYPIYKFLMTKTKGMTFTGKFVSLIENNEEPKQ